ncbi:MAG TPA: hypothetical protein VGL93_15335 [Streptosporangiaceae bacterium]|jgi:acyl-CoA synthetase (AMP-forming)/AMP-acid ligase II
MTSPDIAHRLDSILAEYASPSLSLADLLCDRHPELPAGRARAGDDPALHVRDHRPCEGRQRAALGGGVAAVVLADGVTADDRLTASLREHVKRHYAAHAAPNLSCYLPALPKTPSGKVRRFLVRDAVRSDLADADQRTGEHQ